MRLIRKLESIADLTPEETRALAALPIRVRTFSADANIVREGERPEHCALVTEGFVCRYKDLPDGSRQIMSFHIPGDMPDLQSMHLKVMDHSVAAMVPTRMAFIPHEAMHEICREYPGVAAAFWRDTLIDAAIFREWIVGLGRRSAYGRIAHLLCELNVKLQSVGLADAEGYDLPLTQAELGDALGLSTVHVNRVLQELRRDGLIASQGRRLGIPNWEGLQAAGDFDITYLHLDREARAFIH